MQKLKKFIHAMIISILVIGLIFPPSVFANGDVVTTNSIDNKNRQEFAHGSKVLDALSSQVGNGLTSDDEANFLVVLRNPIKISPKERKNTGERQAYMEASERAIQKFCEKLSSRGIHAKVICRYDLLFCGVALHMHYADARRVATMPEVSSIEYCTSYTLPQTEQLRHRVISKRDVDSNKMIKLHEIESKYKGAGRIVAVIDSGFDTTHPAMRLSDDTSPRIASAQALKKLSDQQGIQYGRYVSKKIPFAYDYANGSTNVEDSKAISHGMHVAGIIAANPLTPSPNGDIVKGVAPECQILAMKVFSGDSTSPEIYTKAMEDAIKLGADAINMSLGAPLGKIGDMQLHESATLKALDTARQMGIVVAMASGNDGVYGGGVTMPTTAAPDYGLVDTPSIAPLALSVASCNNTQITSKTIELKAYPDKMISYQKGNGPAFDDPNRPMKNFCAIVDCGYGTEEDIERAIESKGELYGKIALIQRGGELTFGEKVFNAGKKGAVGVIIYNDEKGGSELVSMMISKPYPVIPSVFIGHADGKFLISKIENGEEPKIRIGAHYVKTANPEGGKLSNFSSWGLSVDGDFKPEILAPGGNIFSTINQGSYVTMSGTSMATPHIAGAIALLGEKADALHLSSKAKYDFIKNMLMSTANPISENGVFVSPRGQGSGLINISAAVKSPVYVIGTDNRCVVLCKNVQDKFGYDITLKNCDPNQSYKFRPRTFLMTDAIKDDRYTLKSTLLNEVLSDVVEVPAGGEIKVHIELDATPFAKTQGQLQPYGYYLEGYTQFEAIDGGENLSIPFVGFRGDWENLPAIEDSIYNLSAHGRKPIYHSDHNKSSDFTHFSTDVEGKWEVCGQYRDGDGNLKYDANRIAFSPNGDGRSDSIRFFATFTRCYQNVKFGIYATDDVTRKNPLTFDSITEGGLKSFNYGLIAPRAYTAPMWEWNGESAPEGRYDAVVQVSPYTSPQHYTTILHTIILDKTPAKVEKCMYDELSRTFTVEKVSDKEASGKQDGSGVREILLYYKEGGKIKYLNSEPNSTKNIGSHWTAPKSWILPPGIPLDEIQLESIDFAGNKSCKSLQTMLNEEASSVLDKKPLEDKIAEAKKITQGNKSDEAFDALKKAIETAEANLASTKTNEGIQSAINALERAIDTFNQSAEKQVVEKDGLKAVIEQANKIKAEDYTESSYEAMLREKAKAQAIYDKQITTVTEVKEATQALKSAINALQKRPVLDKKPLEDKIAEAKKITQGNKTDEAFDALKKAIETAEANLKTVKTRKDVTKTIGTLSNAIQIFNRSKDKVKPNITPDYPAIKPQPPLDQTPGSHFNLPVNNASSDNQKEKPVEKREDQKLETSTQHYSDTIGHWAKKAIDYVTQKGYFMGVGEGHFAPNKTITRADFVTVLGRMANVKQTNYTHNPFRDLSDTYYTGYVLWAQEKGIVKGMGDGKFDPTRAITREEMAVIMSKYLEVTGKTLNDKQSSPFKDEEKISSWAKEAVNMMAKKGIVKGMEDKTFGPQKGFTRAQVAQVLFNVDHE